MNLPREDALVLDRLQEGIPFVPRPWDVIGKELGLSSEDVLSRAVSIKEGGVIRNIAGIFNGESLGYQLSLVAFMVPDENIEKAGALVSAHPGVSHNYQRNHPYNLWFTLAVPPEWNFEETVKILARDAGADDWLILRNEELLKIGVRVRFSGKEEDSTFGRNTKRAAARPFTEKEKTTIHLLQQDLPLTEEPFAALTDGADISRDQFLERAEALRGEGFMRRYSAVLRHHKAGLSHNAMTAWKLERDDRFHERVEIFASSPAVSHLYMRTLYPGRWEYPLFAMVHASSQEELDGLLRDFENRSGLSDRLVLQTVREFKKERVRYFSPEFDEWKRTHHD